MNRALLILFILLVATPAFSQAPDRRISDSDGDVLIINSDGSVPVSISGSVGASQLSELSDVGSSTATSGNLFVSDGAKWNSVSYLTKSLGISTAGAPPRLLSLSVLANTNSSTTLAVGANDPTGANGGTAQIELVADRGDDAGDHAAISMPNDGPLTLAAGRTSILTKNQLVLATDGVNVGVNDNTPDAVFEVVISGSVAPFMVSSSEGANGDWVFVNPNGKVGIGTTNPTKVLDVVGDFAATGWTATSGRMLVADGLTFNSAKISDQFSVVAGANAVCSTTCGTKGCLAGLDAGGTPTFLACNNAAADSCLCAGGLN